MAYILGRTGNAGAIGPMPVMNSDGEATTLIDHASIYTLEMRLKAKGGYPITSMV